MKLLEERLPVESITVMVQREAAQRICAAPGSRQVGAISLAVQYYAEARTLFTVSPGSFTPPPEGHQRGHSAAPPHRSSGAPRQ